MKTLRKIFYAGVVAATLAMLAGCSKAENPVSLPAESLDEALTRASFEEMVHKYAWHTGATFELFVTPNKVTGITNSVFVVFDRPDSCSIFTVSIHENTSIGGNYFLSPGEVFSPGTTIIDKDTYIVHSDITNAAYHRDGNYIYLDNGYSFFDTYTKTSYRAACYNSLDTRKGMKEYSVIARLQIKDGGVLTGLCSAPWWEGDTPPHQGVLFSKDFEPMKVATDGCL